jgi:hypothetical protein
MSKIVKFHPVPERAAPFAPENLITIEEMARRLRPDVSEKQGIAWVREKCRRRSPNPLPVFNLGRHLMFDWIQVSEWIRNSPRPVHAPHRRRTKEQTENDKIKSLPTKLKKAA